MGESDKPKKTVLAQAGEDAMVVDTMGGRVHVHWDETAQATPHGQIVFFAEFLATAGVFDRWVQACPLHHDSPNASRPHDVLGTLMLGILAGSKRHAHIARIRADSGAAMARLLDELGDKAPALVRRDCGYGNEDIFDVCEQRDLRYLLRLLKTANVKRLIERLFRREHRTLVLAAAVGRAANSGRQTTLYLTPMQAEAELIQSMIANVCGHPARRSCCGAVARARLLAGTAGPHLPAHRRPSRPASPAANARGTSTTAGFRFMPPTCCPRWASRRGGTSNSDTPNAWTRRAPNSCNPTRRRGRSRRSSAPANAPSSSTASSKRPSCR